MGNPARLLAGLLCVMLLVGRVGLAAPPEPLPSSADLHAMFGDGEYQALLGKLARVLQLRGEAAKPYDFLELNLLKAEAAMRLKQYTVAQTAANDAVKLSEGDLTTDKGSKAAGLQILLKRATGGAFKGKAAKAKPIDIVDPKSREGAYAALAVDLKAEFDAKLNKVNNLAQIYAGIQSLSELQNIEKLGHTDGQLTRDAGDACAAKFTGFVTPVLADIGSHARSIQSSASQFTLDPAEIERDRLIQKNWLREKGKDAGPCPDLDRRRKYIQVGLTERDLTALTDMHSTCIKIQQACSEFRGISDKQSDQYNAVSKAAGETADAVSKVQNGTYNETKEQSGGPSAAPP